MKYHCILIVDDSSTSRMIVERCFQIAGMADSSYRYAENGLEALSALENYPDIDLIVTDLNMPKMDGNNFIKKIKMDEKNREKSVIVVSSTSDDIVSKELTDAGVLGIIRKPISPAKIRQILGGENG